MSRLENSFNFIALALFLTLSVSLTGSALAADHRTPTWLWPKQSISASQSTKALMIGHTERAVKFAERALETAKGYDRAVALNNLCVGLIRQDDAARVDQVCGDALTTAAEFGYEKIVQTNINIARNTLNAPSGNVAQAAR